MPVFFSGTAFVPIPYYMLTTGFEYAVCSNFQVTSRKVNTLTENEVPKSNAQIKWRSYLQLKLQLLNQIATAGIGVIYTGGMSPPLF